MHISKPCISASSYYSILTCFVFGIFNWDWDSNCIFGITFGAISKLLNLTLFRVLPINIGHLTMHLSFTHGLSFWPYINQMTDFVTCQNEIRWWNRFPLYNQYSAKVLPNIHDIWIVAGKIVNPFYLGFKPINPSIPN